MTSARPFPTFTEFRRSLDAVSFDDIRLLPSAEVESDDALTEMKDHLRAFYEGVEVVHSFADSAGFVVDCVPYEAQPARRGAKEPPPTPPTLPDLPDVSARPKGAKARQTPPPLHPAHRDTFGNQMWCPDGSVPILRTTLEQLARRRTLAEFHRKAPSGTETLPVPGDNSHRYATGETLVPNKGGSSTLNVWRPLCLGSQNSISQHWYAGGVQSLECGWQVCPLNWGGSAEPHLFIYYKTGSVDGFNLGFLYEPNMPYYLGQSLRASIPGGDQFEDELGFFLDGGRWWFRFNGQWLGSIAASVFGNGPLAFGAELARFGGESAGIGVWPPMGSGAFPEGGFGSAAYQRNVVLFQSTHSEIATLSVTDIQTSPCFRIAIANNSPTDWATFFFFGGPGVGPC